MFGILVASTVSRGFRLQAKASIGVRQPRHHALVDFPVRIDVTVETAAPVPERRPAGRWRGQRTSHENKDDGLAFLEEPLDRRDAALLEIRVAHGEDLIEQEDVRVEVGAIANPRRMCMPDE